MYMQGELHCSVYARDTAVHCTALHCTVYAKGDTVLQSMQEDTTLQCICKGTRGHYTVHCTANHCTPYHKPLYTAPQQTTIHRTVYTVKCDELHYNCSVYARGHCSTLHCTALHCICKGTLHCSVCKGTLHCMQGDTALQYMQEDTTLQCIGKGIPHVCTSMCIYTAVQYYSVTTRSHLAP